MGEARTLWIGCLASYNGGVLFGDWLAMDDFVDLEGLQEAIADILKRSPSPGAEEWHLCDHEGWAGLTVDRYPDLSQLWEWHEAFDEHSHYPAAVVAHAITEGSGSNLEESLGLYCGEWDKPGDYAAQFHEDCGTEIPEWLAYHIDWESVEDSMELNEVDLDGKRTLWSQR